MAQYARVEVVRQDQAGNPIVGCSVLVLKQGSTVVSGGPTSFTVNDPGALVALDSVTAVSSDGLTERGSGTVASLTDTNVTLSGGGIAGVVNNDRFVDTTQLAILYADAQGAETISSTLVTDQNGYAAAWTLQQPLDLKMSGGTSPLGVAATIYRFDVRPSGFERRTSFAFMTGTAVLEILDSVRAFTTGDKWVSYRNQTVERWYVKALSSGAAVAVPGHTVEGSLTVTSALVVSSGGATITGGISVVTGGLSITAGGLTLGASGGIITQSQTSGLNVFATDLQLTSKDLRMRHLRANQGTTMTTSDISLGSGWGTGPAVTSVTNATNTSGRVRITTGTGPSGNADFTINLKDSGMASGTNAHCIVQRAGGTISGNIGMVALIVCTATSVTVSVVGALAASTAYDYEWIIIDGA